MKPFLRALFLMCLASSLFASASAQITITASDVNATLALGTTITSRADTLIATANIGSLGSTSWNFSALATHLTTTSASVRPDTTAYFGFFPAATHAQRSASGGIVIYSYLTVGTNLLHQGTGASGAFSIRIRPVPAEILYQLPMTLGTSWTTTYAESTIVVLPPPLPPQVEIANHVVSYTVDAFGNLTLPGGGVHQALRVKSDRRSTYQFGYERTIGYIFIARNGASVGVTAADTTQPTTGTINVENNASWNGPVSTEVRFVNDLPGEFALMQNYPNPFNPSTTIEFDLPRAARARIVVSNILGEEVATLVGGQLEAGRYRETFNADNLPSGVYFYRLQTPEASVVKRMMLLR